jgi:hypothetical protein
MSTDWDEVDRRYRGVMDSEWMVGRPPAVRQAFADYPPWRFYKTVGGSIKRVYGFAETQCGSVVAHTVTAMTGLLNDTIGGTPLNDLVQVNEWSEDDRIRISMCPLPAAFLEVDGWTSFTPE